MGNRGYIRYATDSNLPDSIEIKRQNIQNEIRRITGMKVNVSLKNTQRYLAEELKKPNLKFDLSMWNRILK